VALPYSLWFKVYYPKPYFETLLKLFPEVVEETELEVTSVDFFPEDNTGIYRFIRKSQNWKRSLETYIWIIAKSLIYIPGTLKSLLRKYP